VLLTVDKWHSKTGWIHGGRSEKWLNHWYRIIDDFASVYGEVSGVVGAIVAERGDDNRLRLFAHRLNARDRPPTVADFTSLLERDFAIDPAPGA